MDLNGLIRLIFAKNDLLLGISISLLLIVTVLMLIRSVMEDRQSEKRGGSADLDPKALNNAIEGAMKKVLSDKGIQGALGGAIGSAAAGAQSGEGAALTADALELKKALSEKEAKISALMSDLDALKVQMESSTSVSPNGGPASSGVDIGALQAKLAELQAKLAEYEIIEDDIADLSLFKEENKKLKAELATLKAAVETAQTQVHAANVSVEAVPRTDTPAKDPVQVAQAAVTAKPPPEKFKLDENDAVMGEFAQALAGDKAAVPKTETSFESGLIVSSDSAISDPQAAIDALLAGGIPEPDITNASDIDEPKVDVVIDEFAAVVEGDRSGRISSGAAEIEADAFDSAAFANDTAETEINDSAIGEAEASGGVDPFAGELDTGKIQAEVSKLAAELASMAALADSDSSVLDDQLDTDKLMAEMGMSETPPEKPQIVEAVAPAVKPAVGAVQMEDDLLAEFKDMDFQSAKNTKGS
ncbi:MAG: hypothetical protein U1E10_12600 [Bdellovibrionales bacterium]|nr:hypothetical protein [Bdellovibrionales bacterium]